MKTKSWIEVRLLVPARMQEEASVFLTEFSGRGVIIEEEESGEGAVIRAFFRPEEFGPWQRQELQRYLARLGEHDLLPLGLEVRPAAEDDWAEAWKVHFKPVKVTPRLVIRPPWEEYQPAPGETVVTIYPGMAFGTGRHPTTLLCLQALEQIWEEMDLGRSPATWQVLDVGTGTGILALAAARLEARVLAIDVDPEAVVAALENVRLNALEEVVWVESTPLAALRQQFALILANLTAADLIHWAEALAGRTLPGGALIISGFLTEDLPTVSARFAQYGLKEAGHLTRDEWSALILRRR
ncbi:MAG: 50S ribosomal protein L11 methyltransferase [Desulfobaccales bacterium]